MQANTSTTREPVRIVASSSLWVAGFQGLFGDPCGVEVIGVSLAAALASRDPEVILIDAEAAEVSGLVLDVLGLLRRDCPELKAIVVGHEPFGGFDYDGYIGRLILAGARGYLSAEARPEDLKVALDIVSQGSIWASRRVLSNIIRNTYSPATVSATCDEPPLRTSSGQHTPPPVFNGAARFTVREDEVIRLLMDGCCNREIGNYLGIETVTVKAHLGRIMRKAGVDNRVELSMFALRRRSKQARQSAHSAY